MVEQKYRKLSLPGVVSLILRNLHR